MHQSLCTSAFQLHSQLSSFTYKVNCPPYTKMRISNISQQVAKFDCRTIVGHRFYYYQIVATLLNKNMATLKLCIVPAKVLINGKHKVRISLAHNSNTRYIPTNCIIDTPSQFKEGQVINHPEAASMNTQYVILKQYL